MKKRFWTAAEMEIVRRRYADEPTSELAETLDRTVTMVYQLAAKLGLRKSAVYMASPAACRLRRGDRVGAACRFKKGHVPANIGLRRPGYAPGRMAQTQFKKGERSGVAAKNWMPVGTIRADTEGYLRIKVREAANGEATGFGNTKVWPLLNRHVWEQFHGPIPPGHAVVFKDRDRGHCAIGNLELISRGELMRRNRMWVRLPRELAEVLQLNGALKRKIRGIDEKQNDRLAEPSLRDARSA